MSDQAVFAHTTCRQHQCKCASDVSLNVQQLTERCDVHKHEVASLWDDRSQTSLLQDGSHAVPLALEFFCQ